MIKHHVHLKLFADQLSVKQVISTSTMCWVGSPCVFWPCQTEHETHHRLTCYSQVVRLTADQQQICQPFFNHVDQAVFRVCLADIHATELLDNSDENVCGSEQTLLCTYFCHEAVCVKCHTGCWRIVPGED